MATIQMPNATICAILAMSAHEKGDSAAAALRTYLKARKAPMTSAAEALAMYNALAKVAQEAEEARRFLKRALRAGGIPVKAPRPTKRS